MRMPEPRLQAKCAECEEEEEKLRRKESGCAPAPPTTVPPAVHQALSSPGQPLDTSTRSYFEPRFGRDFSQVRVHTDGRAADSALSVHALAYAVGRDIVFGAGRYALGSETGRRLLAHELAHVVQQDRSGRAAVQRAEVDDNPEFCFPRGGGARLGDISGRVNQWITTARQGAERAEAIALGLPASWRVVNATRIGAAIYQSLGAGGVRSHVEDRIAALPPALVRHVAPSESRFAGQQWLPSVSGQSRTRRLTPVVNLCGTCVGADKLGHFFAQGYEYHRIGRLLRQRIQSWSDEERERFIERISPPLPQSLLPGLSLGGAQPVRITFPREFREDQLVEIYTNEFGKWLEGFEHRLPPAEVAWIRRLDFIPWWYNEGVYGRSWSGALSRADLAANRQGGRFYLDLGRNPDRGINLCDYVDSAWNERSNLTTYTPETPRPSGPRSESTIAEEP